jgi:putative bacteroiocin operon protein
LFQFFILLIYIVAAKISSLDSQLLLSLHIKWTLFSIVGALPVISLQCYFCIRTKNFSKCVATSILGAFGTMILLFVNEDFLVIYPYAQPSLALRARALVDYSSLQWGILLIICIVESGLFFILSLRQLK